MSMLQTDAAELYGQALKQGIRNQRECIAKQLDPCPKVLDDILNENDISYKVDLGLLEIPSELIVGTRSKGRIAAFSSNFMPLLSSDSEFAHKWINLCAAHLGDTGIQEPIRCFEYLGKFYIQEGNKRVSVLKFHDAPTIPGYVIRLVPKTSDDIEIQHYLAFLKDYQYTQLYSVYFTQPGSFAKLQAALDFSVDHEWTDDDRRYFKSRFIHFQKAFIRMGGESLGITVADALIVWLKIYPFEALWNFTVADLNKSIQVVWPDIRLIANETPITVATEPAPEADRNFWGKLFSSVVPTHLNVAFIHELSSEASNWTLAHERGRMRLQEAMGDLLTVQTYEGVGNGEQAVEAMIAAISNGAQVLFTTTAPLIGACRKVAAKYPHIKILNCSISMPYTGVRTYYSRIYEGKFISGAIAGAISKNDKIGYIAANPIFGVPAAINAFALGAQLTNPNARVQLKWSCLDGDPMKELIDDGVDYISSLDIPAPGWDQGTFGAFRIEKGEKPKLLASPFWDWGTLYIKLVQNILDGGWDRASNEQAVNYWWGLDSGVIGLQLSNELPEGVHTLADILLRGISNGTISPFHRTIYSQDGTLRNNGDQYFSAEDILHMDWFCENVDGKLPAFEEMVRGQAIVRLQGIYRDQLPPEKEGIML